MGNSFSVRQDPNSASRMAAVDRNPVVQRLPNTILVSLSGLPAMPAPGNRAMASALRARVAGMPVLKGAVNSRDLLFSLSNGEVSPQTIVTIREALSVLVDSTAQPVLPAVRKACISGEADTFTAVLALARNGVIDLDQQGPYGGTLVHAIAAIANDQSDQQVDDLRGDYLPVAERIAALAKLGAALDARNFNGDTPIDVALKFNAGGMQQAVAALAAAGADLRMPCDRGNTYLHRAARSGTLPMVSALVLCGAPIDDRNDLGETPLHVAARRNPDSAVIALLVKSGADINAKDNEGATALDAAVSCDLPVDPADVPISANAQANPA